MYIRLCETLKDKGKFLSLDEDIYQHIDSEKDYYTSVYYYNEDQKNRFNETGTVSGITDVVTNKLFFDMDSPDNIQIAYDDSVGLVNKLLKLGVEKESIDVYFSGGKGFHIIINTLNEFTPDKLKTLATSLAREYSSFDSSVYNSNRILRVSATKHNKTGLYKRQIPLSVFFNTGVDRIKKLSSEKLIPKDKKAVNLPASVLKIANEKKKKEVATSFVTKGLDLSKRPSNFSPWKYALDQGFFPAQTRHDANMILAATYKGLGYDKTKTYYALKAACEKQSVLFNQDKFSKEEIYGCVDHVFSPEWNDGSYSEDNFPVKLQTYLTEELGVPRRDEIALNVFEQTRDVFKSFDTFAKNIDNNTIKTGIVDLDKNVRMTTGMLCGLLGAPSTGKSSISFEILKNTSLNNEKAAFFSMDMGQNLVFQRLAQNVTGYSSEKLFDIFKNEDLIEQKHIMSQLDKYYKNVFFSFKTAMTTENMKNSILYQQNKTGEKIRLVVIDYLECISSKISDPTAKISNIAQELKDMAIELDVCVLLLLQPPKRVGDPSDEILSYIDIKGSGTVGQACSIVISLWRPGFNPSEPQDDRFMSFAVLKNRMGQLSQVDCSFDGLTGKVAPLDAIGKVNLERVRTKKKLNEKDEEF